VTDAVVGTGGQAAPRFAPVSASYGRYALALLVAIYTINFLDRQIINSIGEAIKTDLGLTDAQIGALGGIFFAFVYTVLGIPIAKIADKHHRPWVMTVCLAIWSGFTVLSGVAKNYAILAIARAGVGIGEAGCSPTAHSLLADYFPREKRATALAIYSTGISIGTLLGFVVGGFVAENWGWRAAFFVAGAPGLLLAVLAILTLVEPRSKLSRDLQAKANAENHIPLLMVFSTLEKRPTFWLFALGGAFTSFVSYAHAQFFLPLFLRNHSPEMMTLATQFDMAPEKGPPLFFTNLCLGLVAGFGGAFGSWMGGLAADKWGVKDIRNYALFPLLVPFISIPCLWWAISTNNMVLAFLLLLIPNIGVGAWWGPVYGGVQGLVPPAMRAMSAAVLLFVINMIGLGGGPTTFGIVTTEMTNHYLNGSGLTALTCAKPAAEVAATCAAAAARGIKMTTYLSTAIIPIAMLCFFLSRFTIGRDFERAETLPAQAMTKARLAFYMFIAGALPGGFLGNASRMFFREPPPMLWLQGLIVGGIVGMVVAFMVAASDKSARAPV
jgi:MFS family permease